MFRRTRAVVGALILLGVAATLRPSSAGAQTQVAVRLSPPLTDEFPTITLYLSVIGATGSHLPGLGVRDFTVLEDEQVASIAGVREMQVGARQVFVVNTSRGLAIRDSSGRTRFDHALQALLEWWARPDAAAFGIDDLTLLTADRELVVHRSMTAALASALDQFGPDLDQEASAFDLLLQALDYTADRPLRPGMENHLVFVTPAVEAPRDLPITNTIAKANLTGTSIYPVLLAPSDTPIRTGIDQLRLLAEATGGVFTWYDSAQGLSSIAERILSRRTVYQLTYLSRLDSSGSHEVRVAVTRQGAEVLSTARSFEVRVQPPEVAFVAPPEVIRRQGDDPTQPLEELPPTSQELRLLITFPDLHPRPLVLSQLIVDGQLVAEQSEEPFDRLTWDLASYLKGESHTLQAVVLDSLGLQGSSVPLPVSIEVELPPSGLAALRPALGSLIAALAVLVAGVVLAVALMNASRQRVAATPPQTSGGQTSENVSTHPRLERRVQESAGVDQGKAAAKRRRPRGGAKRDRGPAEAELAPLAATEGAFLLRGEEVLLGRDATLVSIAVADPSVNPLHAKLIRLAGGEYLIRDQGSVAGTWVNFEPIAEQGQILRHGDWIHLGRSAFRFYLSSPPPPRRVEVRLLADLEPRDGDQKKDVETAAPASEHGAKAGE